jgi:TyrR family helix-turn-helix protein
MPERKGIFMKCKNCGKEFYVSPYRLKEAKFCSRYCYLQYTTVRKKCAYCGKEFIIGKSKENRKYCSEDCMFLALRKIKDERERREKIKIYQRLKRGNNYSHNVRKWLKIIGFPFRCIICGYDKYECAIDIHHIDSNPNNNSIDNLVPLCAICHRLVEKKIINLDDYLKNFKVEFNFNEAIKRRQQKKIINFDDYFKKKLYQKYVIEGKSMRQIGKELGIDHTKISRKLREFGILQKLKEKGTQLCLFFEEEKIENGKKI